MQLRKIYLTAALLTCACFLSWSQSRKGAVRAAFQDKDGVFRWVDDKKEISLYGANYCVASACDYRAANYVTKNLKQVVDQDMAHFARMGFDALRLSFWGDYENTDAAGNLVQNDHLNMLDYVVAKAKERGIYMLLSPIVTYSSTWPDASRDTLSIKGSLAQTFKKAELGTNPKAIAAECNYLKQLLNHVNPYTGIALKNEPAIVFIEMINEPWHHSEDIDGSVKYINALVEAVRSTGCKKITFHNLSQDFKMAVPMQKSNIQGLTFAWYPSGLNSGHLLKGNYLPVVDEYTADMLRPELKKLGRIVYEFDSPDLLNGYMYPAMARSFRRMGAQWASIFSYDMLATAPYNLGWQTHYINMVYTPAKAISAIISNEVMKTIPMYKDYGKYPGNTVFGPFKVDYEKDLGQMNAPEKFYYTNTTADRPVAPGQLNKIVGHGSSSVVNYEGRGIYFMDKINKNTWRLEVYPDAVLVDDPFKMPSPDKIVTRSIHHIWPMQIELPGLGPAFKVLPLNDKNTYFTKAIAGKFDIQPGVYILTGDDNFNLNRLPDHLGYVGMKEFITLPDQDLPTQITVNNASTFVPDKPLEFSANVYSLKDPLSVTLYLKTANSRNFTAFPMKRSTAYTYSITIPENNKIISPGNMEYCIVVKDQHQTNNFPSGSRLSPSDWNYSGSENYKGRILPLGGLVKLVDPDKDAERMSFTRIGDGIRNGIFKMVPSSETGDDAIHLELPLSYDRTLDDYTVSVAVKDRIRAIGASANQAKAVMLQARGKNKKQEAYITLVENDGTCWSKVIPLTDNWAKITIALDELSLSQGAMLPLGYPGRWKYWFTPADGRGKTGDRIQIENVEWVQISMRQAKNPVSNASSNSYIDLSGVELLTATGK